MNDKTGQVEAPSASKPYWVYLLECADGSFYCGIALDVQARFAQHLAGTGAAYTRSHKPVMTQGGGSPAHRQSPRAAHRSPLPTP